MGNEYRLIYPQRNITINDADDGFNVNQIGTGDVVEFFQNGASVWRLQNSGAISQSGTVTYSSAAPLIFTAATPVIDANNVAANLTFLARRNAANTGVGFTWQTLNGADAITNRLTISSGVATALVTWNAVTHTGLTSSGTFAVNAAGGITTDQTTFPLINATATTVNFAGAATTLTIGAAASVTTWTGQSISLTGANTTNNTTLTITNSTNTAVAAHSIVDIAVGGTTSTGKPQLRFTVPGGTSWYVGTTSNILFYIGTGTTVGSGPVIQLDARFTSEGTDLVRITGGTPNVETLASGGTAERGRLNIIAHTLNYTGNTIVSSLVSTVKLQARTLASDTATLTVSQATTLESIAPIQGLNVTLTHGSAIRILNQATSGTNQYGVYFESLSGATNNYGIAFANAPNGGSIISLAGINLVINALTTGAVVIQSGGTEFIRANNTGVGFFAVAPVARQTGGANLTNSVTAGGVNDTIADFAVTVAIDTVNAASQPDVNARLTSIRNDIYQLARSLKQDHDALRAYGLLT